MRRWKLCKELFAAKPLQYISIPVIAAGVGYVTNYLGVNMLFYPLEDKFSYHRWPDQPVGLFGWQGIVPCKRVTMATTLVDVSLTKLLKISEIFERLDPSVMAEILQQSMAKCLLGGMLPLGLVHYMLDKVAAAIIREIEEIVSIKDIVVVGLTTDPAVLGAFFQRVGEKELKYLVDSGTYFGFLLGLFQMTQLMLFPANWTLPISGAIVGFMTNWIALQLIFKPIEPVHFKCTGDKVITIQGFCLARQKEVSLTFSEYIANNVLTSEDIWQEMLNGSGDGKLLRKVITDTLPFLPSSVVDTVMDALRKELGHASVETTLAVETNQSQNTLLHDKAEEITGDLENPLLPHVAVPTHRLHSYINTTMRLEETLIERMNTLTPTEFERILHPVFEEDEMTLIVAGGILGFTAGAMQWWLKVLYENNENNPRKGKGVMPVTPTGVSKGRYMKSAKSTITPLSQSHRLNNKHRRLFSTMSAKYALHPPHNQTAVWRIFRRFKLVL